MGRKPVCLEWAHPSGGCLRVVFICQPSAMLCLNEPVMDYVLGELCGGWVLGELGYSAPWPFACASNTVPQIPLSWGCLQISLRHRWLQLAGTTLFPQLECSAGTQRSPCQYRLSGIESLKCSQRQYCSPQGHQKQKFPSISELDAPSLWVATHSSVLARRIPGMGSHRVGHDWSDSAVAVAAFSPRRMTLWAFSLCSPHATGTGGAERRGQGAAGCHQLSGSPWDTKGGPGKVETAWNPCLPFVPGEEWERPAQWRLLSRLRLCAAPRAAGFSENLPSLFFQLDTHGCTHPVFSWEQAVIY